MALGTTRQTPGGIEGKRSGAWDSEGTEQERTLLWQDGFLHTQGKDKEGLGPVEWDSPVGYSRKQTAKTAGLRGWEEVGPGLTDPSLQITRVEQAVQAAGNREEGAGITKAMVYMGGGEGNQD